MHKMINAHRLVVNKISFILQEITTHECSEQDEVVEYSEEEDVCTQQTSTNPAEAVYLEERFEIYCQESGVEFGNFY